VAKVIVANYMAKVSVARLVAKVMVQNQENYKSTQPNTILGSCRQDNEFFDRCGGCERTCTNPNVTFHFCFTISPI